MFESGDVEGALREDVVKETGIKSQVDGVDRDMETTLRWAVHTLMDQLPLLAKAEQ
jgi:nicotinamide/nicotinate riboside kinase